MQKEKIKVEKRTRRRAKIRSKVTGTVGCPRLSVFRSNTGMFLQIINDETGETLVSAHSKEIKDNKAKKIDISLALGKLLAEKAVAKKIKIVVFDRGGYKYHGRIKAAADGAREGGLEF
jgi:large subunit ribosomal protein L18